MNSGHLEPEGPAVDALVDHPEIHAVLSSLDVHRAYMRARAPTVSTHSRLEAGDEPARPVIVRTDDGRPVWQKALEELPKSLHDTFEGTVDVEVVGLDVGHDGHCRLQLQKRSVVFISLDHIEIAAAPKVTAPSRHAAADKGGRIHPRCGEKLRCHRRGGGFAVCASNRQHATLIDPLAQGLRSLEDRNPPVQCLLYLRVVRWDGRADDESRRPLHVTRLVPLVYLYVQGPELVCARSRPEVTPRHAAAELRE